MPDIDNLSIQISAKVNSDQAKLDNLNKSLSKLQTIVNKNFGQLDTIVAKLSNLRSLDNVKDAGSKINSLANSLAKLKSVSLAGFSKKMDSLARGIQPLANVSVDTIKQITSFGASINKFANAMGKIDKIDVASATKQILGITKAIKPLTDEMLRGGTVANSYALIISKLGKGVAHTEKRVGRMTSSFTRMVGSFYLIKRGLDFVGDMVMETAKWTENLNLFANSFGEKQWQGVLDWTQEIAQNFGFASNELVKFTGLFKQLSTSLGIADEIGTELSKTLTQLALDFSSFYNVDLERSFATFQSAIFGGQTKGARLLFGVEVAYQSLDQILKTTEGLKELGVTAKMLTQDQKALLRTIAFLTAGRNSFGDMAKTINSTMNQIRIFEGALANLKLALGDLLLAEPFRKMLVNINGIIIGITEVIRAFTGFNKDVSLSNPIEQLSEMNDEMQKTKGNLLSFDKFESLSKNDSNGIGNLEVTKALTEELRKQSAIYEEMQQQMSGVKNEAVEISKKIKDFFIFATGDKDKNGNPIYKWTTQAKILFNTIKLIIGSLIVVKSFNFVSGLFESMGKFLGRMPDLIGNIFIKLYELGPVPFIIATIVGLLGALYVKNEKFRDSVNNLFNSLRNVIKPILEPIMNILGSFTGLLEPILNIVGILLSGPLNVLAILIESIAVQLEYLSIPLDFISRILESILTIARDILSLNWSEMKSNLNDIWDRDWAWEKKPDFKWGNKSIGSKETNNIGNVGLDNAVMGELLSEDTVSLMTSTNQGNLEDTFYNALVRYSNNNNNAINIKVDINDNSSFGEFTRKIARPVVEEGRRIGVL